MTVVHSVAHLADHWAARKVGCLVVKSVEMKEDLSAGSLVVYLAALKATRWVAWRVECLVDHWAVR